MIYGNVDGIKDSILKELENIYDMIVPKYTVCTLDIINIISRISSNIEKEVSVGIDRKGKVASIAIGDSNSVEIPIININEKKLSGIRIIHTHPNGIANLSALDLSSLCFIKLSIC